MISFPIKNFFLYLVFILPLTYVFGIAITEINVLILIIYFLYKNKDLSYFKDKKFIYLFFFSFYISINSLIHFLIHFGSIDPIAGVAPAVFDPEGQQSMPLEWRST